MIKYLVYILAFGTFFTSVIWFSSPVLAADASSNSSNSINVETIKGETLTEKFVSNLKESWPWYVTRGSGLIAALTLVILMLSGIGQITGYTFKVLDPITAWASHRALGIVFGLAVLLHISSILIDHFLRFTLPEVLVPWLSDFRPAQLFGFNLGSLYLAFGIIAFYLSLVIIVTSLTLISKKPHLWKFIHIFTYVVIALIFVHALFIGTDLAHGWLRALWIILGISIAYAAFTRLKRAYTT